MWSKNVILQILLQRERGDPFTFTFLCCHFITKTPLLTSRCSCVHTGTAYLNRYTFGCNKSFWSGNGGFLIIFSKHSWQSFVRIQSTQDFHYLYSRDQNIGMTADIQELWEVWMSCWRDIYIGKTRNGSQLTMNDKGDLICLMYLFFEMFIQYFLRLVSNIVGILQIGLAQIYYVYVMNVKIGLNVGRLSVSCLHTPGFRFILSKKIKW